MASKLEPLEKLLGKNLKTSDVSVDSLKENDIVGIYFSSHDCCACRDFTPVLIDLYEKLRAEGKKFEVVFVSWDSDKASWKGYNKSMPWLLLPYNDRKRREDLDEKFSVTSIPVLVLVDPKDGSTISRDGRFTVTLDPEGKNFPWKKRR